MINSEQLKQPLNDKFISFREIGKTTVGYVESHHVIREANNLFGFGEWNYTIKQLSLVSTEQKENKYNKILNYAGYTAIVTITVKNGEDTVTREDVGFGQGIDADAGKAHEGATKEAVTDALKRGLRTFGDSFGLALYAKDGQYIFTETISEETIAELETMLSDRGITIEQINGAWGIKDISELQEKQKNKFIDWLKTFEIKKPCNESQIEMIRGLLNTKDVDVEKFMAAYKILDVSELSFTNAGKAVMQLQKKANKS